MVIDLTIEESNKIRKRLLQELNHYSISKNGYWYPLCKISNEIDSISFVVDDLNNSDVWKCIYQILKEDNITCLYEVQEFVEVIRLCPIDDYFFEKDEEGYDMLFMSECYWFDEKQKCLIYTSHEGTISFTGTIAKKICENKVLKGLIKNIYFQIID